MTGTGNDVVLPALPALGELYGRAVAAAVRRRIGRRPSARDLPSARHSVEDVRADPRALARFQRLLGSAGRDALPSAYVHTMAFPVAMSVLARDDFPLPLLGMVHLSNEVHQRRQIAVSELLDVVAWAEDLRPHGAGTQVDLVVEVRAADGLVWTGRSVYLARGVHPDRAPAATPSRAASREDRPPFDAPVPTAVWVLDAAAGRRYAGVSGDWNPIHLNGPAAKALGMRTLIAHGMYLAARMVDQAVPAPLGSLRWRIDFAAPVVLPGTVRTAFTRAREDTGDSRVDVVGWSASRGRVHFTGWVREA